MPAHRSPPPPLPQAANSSAIWGDAVAAVHKVEGGEGSKGLAQGLSASQSLSMLDRFLPKLKR